MKTNEMKEIERFIRSLHRGEIRISPRANEIAVGSSAPLPRGIRGATEERRDISLAEELARIVTNYQMLEDLEAKKELAEESVYMVERARTSGVILEKESTKILLDDCRSQYKNLLKDYNELKLENEELKRDNEMLSKFLKTPRI